MSAKVSKCFSVALAKVLNSHKYDSDMHLQGKTIPFIGNKSPKSANKNGIAIIWNRDCENYYSELTTLLLLVGKNFPIFRNSLVSQVCLHMLSIHARN